MEQWGCNISSPFFCDVSYCLEETRVKCNEKMMQFSKILVTGAFQTTEDTSPKVVI